jgi:selenide,water dikinase
LSKVVDPNVLVGTQTHDDAGVYRLTEELALVQTIDFFPLVINDPFRYGQIAAANSLSDVYAIGGEQKTGLNLVGNPDDRDPGLTRLAEMLKGERSALPRPVPLSLAGTPCVTRRSSSVTRSPASSIRNESSPTPISNRETSLF